MYPRLPTYFQSSSPQFLSTDLFSPSIQCGFHGDVGQLDLLFRYRQFDDSSPVVSLAFCSFVLGPERRSEFR